MEREKLSAKLLSAHQLPEIINGLEAGAQAAQESLGGTRIERAKDQGTLQQLGQAAVRRPHHHGFARHPQDY